MKIVIIDMCGTKIEGAFFDDAADHFDKRLKEGSVYLFANGNVKLANKKFTTVKNDFSLVFEKSSKIEETEDDGSIAGINSAFEFTSIKQLEESPSG